MFLSICAYELISTTDSASTCGMSQTKGRVLVVDDEIDTARTLGRILETSGFVVDIFTDPQAALESFKTGCYDLAQLMLECQI